MSTTQENQPLSSAPEPVLNIVIHALEKGKISSNFKKPNKNVVCRSCPKATWTIDSGLDEGTQKLTCHCAILHTEKWNSDDDRPNEVTLCSGPFKE